MYTYKYLKALINHNIRKTTLSCQLSIRVKLVYVSFFKIKWSYEKSCLYTFDNVTNIKTNSFAL